MPSALETLTRPSPVMVRVRDNPKGEGGSAIM